MTENDMDCFIVSTPKSKALRRAFMGNTLADLDRRVDRYEAWHTRHAGEPNRMLLF